MSLDERALLSEENRALEAALDLSRRRFGVMREIAHAVSGQLELDELLRVIIGKVSELVDCDRTTLFVVDAAREEIWSRVAEGKSDVIRLPLGSGVAGFVAKTGIALNLPDAYVDARFNPVVDTQTGYQTRSILCTPILDVKGKPMGVIEALNKRASAFTLDDERLLEAISGQLSVALTNALLFEDVRVKAAALEDARGALARRVSELDALVDVERAFATASTSEEVLDGIVRRATELLAADAASAVIVDALGGLRFHATTGDAKDLVLSRAMPAVAGLVGAAIERRSPVRVDDASTDARHASAMSAELGFVPGALLAVPMLADGRAYGALEVMRKRGAPPFTVDDERILVLVSSRVAAALDTARRRERNRREAQLETIGHMLAGIVHDFKTPMTVISGFVQLMALEENATERQACANAVLKSCDLMTSMTRELLLFARGETEILIRKMPLPQFVAEVDELLKQVTARTRIVVTTSIGYRGAVRIDEVKMKRALTNLAKNAREAMGDDGELFFGVEQKGDQIELVLRDSGPGLPPEIEARLFESFATHGKQGGTGLGLAIVKKIVDEHGGDIRVESTRGAGVTFRLRLPL